MKKTILTFLTIVPLICKAQAVGYPTIMPDTVQPDDSWVNNMYMANVTVHYQTEENEDIHLTYSYGGTETIAERTFVRVKVMRRPIATASPISSALLYEYRYFDKERIDTTFFFCQEGDKVYCSLDKGGEAILVLDYGMTVGDEFVASDGRHFKVTETGYFEEYDKSLFFDRNKLPKMLRLLSDEGEEDVWIEGIGSVKWGILPLCLASRNRVFDTVPVKSQLCCVRGVYGIRDIEAVFDISEGNYFFSYFVPGEKKSDKERYTEISFNADTLCIKGIGDVYSTFEDTKEHYIELMVHDENTIAWNFMARYPISSYVCREYEVKIPGFKAGTYQYWVAENTTKSIICDGANGVENISETLRHENQKGGIYDLSGRRVDAKAYENENGKLKKGIYIKDGKKTVVR